MARLRKHQAEALLDALAVDGPDPGREITEIRRLLTPALRQVLDAPDAEWDDLIARGSTAGGWTEERRRLLRGGTGDIASERDGLWDLVTELSERRTIG